MAAGAEVIEDVTPGLGWPRDVHVDPRIGWPDVPRETLGWTSEAHLAEVAARTELDERVAEPPVAPDTPDQQPDDPEADRSPIPRPPGPRPERGAPARSTPMFHVEHPASRFERRRGRPAASPTPRSPR